MRPVLRLFLTLACGLSFPAWADAAATAIWTDEKARQLEYLAAKYVSVKRRDHRPLSDSISIAIGTHKGLFTAVAYGSAAPGQPATPDTIYQVGSLTKPFTAFATLRLLDLGARTQDGSHLSLDTPLNKIFTDVGHWKSREGTDLTLRNLLTMTSTLPNLTSRPPSALNPWGRAPAAHILVALKATHPRLVASTFEYSNTSYFLLSEVIDGLLKNRTQGPRSYREFLRHELFEKTGMTHTGFLGDAVPKNAKVAKPRYSAKPAFVQPDWLKGSADMHSTATDIYKMNQAMFDGKLLSENSNRLMFTELNRVTPFDWYGMGWFIRDDRDQVTYSHSGSVPGFTSFNQVTRMKTEKGWLAITLLTNSTDVEGLDILANDIKRLIRQE